MGIYSGIRKYYKGVSWTNPAVSLMLRFIDPVDYTMRLFSGLTMLPAFSARVRSNGMRRQIGGKRFYHYGKLTSNLLQQKAGLKPESKVLEIGCGSGRTAIALTEILNSGNYTGMDIEKYSIESCRKNSVFEKKKFHFDLIDIYNREYNPEGKFSPSEYIFPYSENQFDVIFMISVFTHMMPADTKHYIKEFARILKPGGKVFISTFLMDDGFDFEGMKFPFEEGECRIMQKELPEFGVGYQYHYYENEFSKYGMKEFVQPLKGHWRGAKQALIAEDFPQDIVVFGK